MPAPKVKIEICTDPDYYDAGELAECTTLTGADLVEAYRVAAEKILRDSGQFPDAEYGTGSSRFMDVAWGKTSWENGYVAGGVATLSPMGGAQQMAMEAAQSAGNRAMHKAITDHSVEPDWP